MAVHQHAHQFTKVHGKSAKNGTTCYGGLNDAGTVPERQVLFSWHLHAVAA
jgi:hypothetical protein